MEVIKFRKRVPTSLYPYVRKKEVKKSFSSRRDYEAFSHSFSKALMFANDPSLPTQTKRDIITSIIPEVIAIETTSSSTLIKDVASVYLGSLTCSQREINDRHHFLTNILVPNSRLNDVTLFKHSDIKELQKSFTTKVKHRGKQVSIRTANKYLTWLKNFFQFCYNEEYIKVNPAIGIKALKSEHINERNQRDALTKEEIETLLASSQSEELYYFIKLCYLTGMRLSEFSKAKVTILEGIPVFDLKSTTSQLKTRSSYRVVPIHHDLGGTEVVRSFLDSHDPKSIQNLARRVKYLIDKTLKETNSKTCYSLRHSFATHLIQHGMDTNIVSELMGHSHQTMTLSRYSKGYSMKSLAESLAPLKAIRKHFIES